MRKILSYFPTLFSLANLSFALSMSLMIAFMAFTLRQEFERERIIMALAENVYHEGRGELVGYQYFIGLITLARAADQDRQWPKSIVETIAQDRAFSWVLDHRVATRRNDKQAWNTAVDVARELERGVGTTYRMPRGWECVRFYKRTDNKGVSKKSEKWFKKLVPVAAFGSHTAYRERRGCKTQMATT